MSVHKLELPEDLVVRGRRGLLSEGEQRELERVLEGSASLRVAHLVGRDLDRATQVQTGDEARILSAVDRVLAGAPPASERSARTSEMRLRPSGTKRRRVMAAIAICATLCASGIAAAELAGVRVVPWLTVAPVTQLQKGMESASLPPLPRAKPIAAAAPSTEKGTPTGEAPAPITRQKEASAAQLFHDANSARRSGEFQRAKGLYSRLIARYPESDEARLARVSLGKLLLEKGEPSQAEREFRRYLSKGGQLAEEALVSRAESLGKMKRPNQERQAWQELLSRYPNSVYAARARQRISALGSKH